MKRVFLFLGCLAVMTASISSCTTMKRDCQGGKHKRLPNGIYL